MDIPSIGFGTYRLNGDTYNSVRHALKIGYTHIDTAPLYKNELIVGKAIKDSGVDRRRIFVTTKISRNELKTNDIKKSIENSLNVLKLDYIDLLLLHEPIDFINNWKLLSDYYNTNGRGIIKNIGVSNFNINHLNIILNSQNTSNTFNTIPYCNQIEINPFLHRTPIVELCNKNNIKIVAHSPLAKGEKLNNETLTTMAQKFTDCSPAQLMLTWNHLQNNIVIPRSKNIDHISQNLSAISSISELNLDTNDTHLLNSLDCQYSTHPKYL